MVCNLLRRVIPPKKEERWNICAKTTIACGPLSETVNSCISGLTYIGTEWVPGQWRSSSKVEVTERWASMHLGNNGKRHMGRTLIDCTIVPSRFSQLHSQSSFSFSLLGFSGNTTTLVFFPWAILLINSIYYKWLFHIEIWSMGKMSKIFGSCHKD